ncbi:MAG: c-type cytochrome [Phycisphaerae bacterium]|nr:c-type cytochrome [Phycisphaerae bacterium]
MSVQSPGPLSSHEYDGIREYDNPTPGWWYAILTATVVFSAVYFVFWHASVAGWSIHDSWEDDQRAEYARIFGAVGQLKPDEASILAQMGNPKFMNIARATFIGNCASCHARDGGGDVGVNLCDESYKNVVKIEDLFRVITDGANGGAMPSWKNRLSDNERVILASYVASLRGTTPARAKAPEGQPIPPWPRPAAPVATPPAPK